MTDGTALRLDRARLVLQGVEEREGIRSYARRTLIGDALQPGVFETGTAPTQVLAAMKTAFSDETWMATTGLTNLGWEAVQRAGIDLRRVVRVVCPPPQASAVVATLLEGFELIVIGDLPLTVSQQRVLSARAKMLERIILTTNTWPFISVLLPTKLAAAGMQHQGVG